MGESKAQRFRIDLSDLVLEIISIVIAIVLATAVGQAVQHYHDSARTSDALREIRSEIIANRSALDRVRPLHERIALGYESLVRGSHGQELDFTRFAATFARVAPRGINPFRGEDTAWQLARTSSAIGDTPFSLRAALQRVYFEQETLSEVDRTLFQTFLNAPTTSRPNYYFVAEALTLEFNDVVASETRLDARYAEALTALADAGIR